MSVRHRPGEDIGQSLPKFCKFDQRMKDNEFKPAFTSLCSRDAVPELLSSRKHLAQVSATAPCTAMAQLPTKLQNPSVSPTGTAYLLKPAGAWAYCCAQPGDTLLWRIWHPDCNSLGHGTVFLLVCLSYSYLSAIFVYDSISWALQQPNNKTVIAVTIKSYLHRFRHLLNSSQCDYALIFFFSSLIPWR